MKIDRYYLLLKHFRKKHNSSHYDIRIVSITKKFLVSFAIPKMKFPVKGNKVLAIRTPDHSLNTLDFQGKLENGDEIKQLEKDKCTYISVSPSKIDILFHGKILNGHYIFVKMYKDNWLLISK